MSKHNKANKSNYIQAGRLSPDDLARERVRQAEISGRAKGKENFIGKTRERDEPASSPRQNEPEE